MKTRMMMAATLMAAAVTLWGCPNEGELCGEGLTSCGDKTCEDLTSDKRNCGGCGVTCQLGEVCSASECVCAPGATDCNGACVTTTSNPEHCGACGVACASPQVCEMGACATTCSQGATQCGQSCVLTATDPNNCGGCGVICDQGQSCHASLCTYDVVLACFTNGQVRGLQNGTHLTGPLKQFGTGPQALDVFADELLLSADGLADRVYQGRLTDLTQLPPSTAIGPVANDLLVFGDYVFVIESGAGTLTVLQRGVTTDGGVMTDGGSTGVDAGGADAGGVPAKFPNGVDLGVVAQVQFGQNTYPQVMTKVGDKLYVTLFGGFDSMTAAAGQKVVEVDVSNPESPAVQRTFELGMLPLENFDAGAGENIPRPSGITHRGGVLYVALADLDVNYSVAGPGYLATLPLDGGAAGLVRLPDDKCRNAVWTATAGDNVVVSCAGESDYSMFPVVTTKATGLALVGANDQLLSTVSVSCPANGDGGCASPSIGRFGVFGNSVYAADQSAGRLFVFDIVNNQLVEKRTYANGQEPLLVCPVDAMTGYSNVGDVLAIQ